MVFGEIRTVKLKATSDSLEADEPTDIQTMQDGKNP
jgi:hypothetical protein